MNAAIVGFRPNRQSRLHPDMSVELLKAAFGLTIFKVAKQVLVITNERSPTERIDFSLRKSKINAIVIRYIGNVEI
jgi:hypothetical protein